MKEIVNKVKSYFLYSSEHRSGIFWLLLLLVFFAFSFKIIKNNRVATNSTIGFAEMELYQKQLDSLSEIKGNSSYTLYPYNPNFITDYKGYKLGMSKVEIKRLHDFRATNNYVNSAKEFQKITQISDSLLQKLSPLFKFPDWVTNPKSNSNYKDYKPYEKKVAEKIVPKDINTATKQDLMDVYGIGDKISDNILQEKEKFGQFLSMKQLQFIWGISPEVTSQLQKRFFISQNISVVKVDINNASIKELAKFPYFTYGFAKQIVSYRSMNGDFKNIEDLTKISNCPLDKIEIIDLYLDFK